MSSAGPTKMTADEYLAWEREQDGKHEYDGGEVFAMSGASARHNALCAAIMRDLGALLRHTECRVFSSDQCSDCGLSVPVEVCFDRRLAPSRARQPGAT